MSYIANPEGEVDGIKLSIFSRAIKKALDEFFLIRRAIAQLEIIFKGKHPWSTDGEVIRQEIQDRLTIIDSVISILKKIGYADIVRTYWDMRSMYKGIYGAVRSEHRDKENVKLCVFALGSLEKNIINLVDQFQIIDFDLFKQHAPKPRTSIKNELILERAEIIPQLRNSFIVLVNAFNDLVVQKDVQKANHTAKDYAMRFKPIVTTLRYFADNEGRQMADGLEAFMRVCASTDVFDSENAEKTQKIIFYLHGLLPDLLIAPPFKGESPANRDPPAKREPPPF